MDVSPRSADVTIRVEGEPYWHTVNGRLVFEPEVKEYTSFPSELITCFSLTETETVTITAIPDDGYEFEYWEFNYWPLDLNEKTDRTKNPIAFVSTFLSSDGYVKEGDKTPRYITAHLSSGSTQPEPPDAPQNVSATDGTETGKVVVTWDASTGANNYRIHRAGSLQGDKTLINQTTGTTFEDTTVVDDNTYYYWVQAVNLYGASAYSTPDSGYAFVDDVEPPPPAYEATPITPAEAKEMLDTELDVIVIDVSSPGDFDKKHIICAINGSINVFGYLDSTTYMKISEYTDFPILVYDQDGSESKSAADYLAGKGFSDVYYMTGGLKTTDDIETVNSDQLYECSLPPIALAGRDLVVNENEMFSLDGSGSKAADNKGLTYAWQQYPGTEADVIDDTGVNGRFTSPYVQEGGEKLIFLLTVTDSQNNQDTDTVAVDVIWENSPPVADAGSFQTVAEDATVILDGSESWDRDDGIVSYQWERISGPEVTLRDSTSEIARFTAPKPDTDEAEIVFELTVTDKNGLSDTDQVTILVTRNNVPPVADAGSDQTVSETNIVLLNGSGSHDADDGIATYAWTQVGDGPTVSLSSHTDVQPTFAAPELDGGSVVLVFQLTVTDKTGAQNSDQVTITVNDAGDPPTADAGTDRNPVYEGWKIYLDATESADADGEIASYQWTQISGPDVDLTGADSASAEFTVPHIDENSVQIKFLLTVTDNVGLMGTDQVKIVVTKSDNPPTADAGADQEIKERKPVVLDGSGSSDPDDGIKTYSWEQTSGEPVVALSDNSAVNPEFTAPDVDKETVLVFKLTVTSYDDSQDTDTVQIRIKPSSGSDSSCFISTLD